MVNKSSMDKGSVMSRFTAFPLNRDILSNICVCLLFSWRVIGSLYLAVVLIAIYAAALVAGTAVEKLHGAAAAQTHVYHAAWFVALNMVLAVNVLTAVLARFPWRLRQTGFVTAHLGVVVLLVGCLLSWCFGDRAMLPLVEGKASHRLMHDQRYLDVKPKPLGFQVYLHKFRRKLDPGSDTASHYSSTVDFLDRDDPPKVLLENVEIKLNEPVDFTDPSSGRTYRLFQSSFDGPWFPGQETFEHLTGGDRGRDHIYTSILSVNHDPGRWWKYIGSLLIVVGIVLVYFVRLGRRGGASTGRSAVVVACLSILLFSSSARADETQQLDWSKWRRLPVFGTGRVEPLDTFARKTVENIVGERNPLIVLEDGRSRRFTASELLFAWLAEPERWETIAFLPADNPWLRGVLDLPLEDETGRPLRYVAPADFRANKGFSRYWDKLQKRAEEQGENFKLSDGENRLMKLIDAYGLYRRLTFDADDPKDMPWRFFKRKLLAEEAWRTLVADRKCVQLIKDDDRVRDAMIENGGTLQKLRMRLHDQKFSLGNIEPAVVEFRRSCDKLASLVSDGGDVPLKSQAAALTRQAAEMHLALYDNGDTLRLLPALNPGALEMNRLPADDASPWLNFQALLRGGDSLIGEYPQAELKRVREAFAAARAAYRDEDAADRNERFAAAVDRFARSLRELAEETEPSRRALLLLSRDESLLDVTAYPPQEKIDAEVFYNRLNPFFWSWIVGIVAVAALLAAVGKMREAAFWSGAAAMAVSLAFVLAGLCLRTYITGLVPLTGMFESVVVVATFVFLLGLWLTLWPLLEIVHYGADVPSAAKRAGRVEQVYRRRLFALSGAIVGTLAMVLAYFAPATVMHRDIGAAAPILRDNFWLVVHVVTIMAGYASAAIALILGNISLGYYLFGRYSSEDCTVRQPPACGVIARFIYTAIKITVLLLTAGTILGALWADKSWGRFWGWDPKEVWALVSLLVYLWFLHARHIRWSGDFGMAATAILGAIVILFNWYGVNFVLGTGMHAYTSGAGAGQTAVVSTVALQWLFLLAAGVRYLMHKTGGVPSS